MSVAAEGAPYFDAILLQPLWQQITKTTARSRRAGQTLAVGGVAEAGALTTM